MVDYIEGQIPNIKSIVDLTKHILNFWEIEKKKAEGMKKVADAELKKIVGAEKTQKKIVDDAEVVIAKLEEDFEIIKGEAQAEVRKRHRAKTIRAEDVKSGKNTLREFQSQNITDAQYEALIEKDVLEEVENAQRIIDQKKIDLLYLKETLYKTQRKIRSLLIQPVRILQQAFRDMLDISENELGVFVEEMLGADSALAIVQDQVFRHKLAEQKKERRVTTAQFSSR